MDQDQLFKWRPWEECLSCDFDDPGWETDHDQDGDKYVVHPKTLCRTCQAHWFEVEEAFLAGVQHGKDQERWNPGA